MEEETLELDSVNEEGAKSFWAKEEQLGTLGKGRCFHGAKVHLGYKRIVSRVVDHRECVCPA